MGDPLEKTVFHKYTSMAPCRDELAVVACSALKQKYRDVLSGRERGQQHVRDVAFVSIHMSIQHRALLAMSASSHFGAVFANFFSFCSCQPLIITTM